MNILLKKKYQKYKSNNELNYIKIIMFQKKIVTTTQQFFIIPLKLTKSIKYSKLKTGGENMKINNNEIHFNNIQKEFLKNFFNINIDFIETKDMLDSDNISLFAETYLEYLKKWDLISDQVLYYFYFELKLSQLQKKAISKNLSSKERIMRMTVPASSIATRCKNDIINKWRHELKVVKVVSQLDKTSLDKQIEHKAKQNKLERISSWEDARNKIVR